MAIAWILDARASETCAVRSVSCPRAFSGFADVGFAGESGVFFEMCGLDGSGGLERRLCGASHNTVDSITGESASDSGMVMRVLG